MITQIEVLRNSGLSKELKVNVDVEDIYRRKRQEQEEEIMRKQQELEEERKAEEEKRKLQSNQSKEQQDSQIIHSQDHNEENDLMKKIKKRIRIMEMKTILIVVNNKGKKNKIGLYSLMILKQSEYKKLYFLIKLKLQKIKIQKKIKQRRISQTINDKKKTELKLLLQQKQFKLFIKRQIQQNLLNLNRNISLFEKSQQCALISEVFIQTFCFSKESFMCFINT
ncbi:unnamed protein product [Paramecium sonneborni]|uniref:Uncharacterized protein n=1 Tax=Paramecium sonneborni TaxID=65129 RepID=A0A8S1QZ13_9CILI|nr:unnamed protein product [Paramecium sonneborni]